MTTPSEPELRVCRHCSVGSRTDAESCPSCGRPYERRWWRWWFAIPIIVLAFAGGYFGLSELVFDDDQPGLTEAEATALRTGGAPGDLEAVVDGEKPLDVRRQKKGGFDLICRYYSVVDLESTAWEACYLSGRLEVSRPLELR
jgi:hypothetical protein